ncbi:MAG: 5-formyltetrahydrofolate cyclo-ligase [Candidatus Margulisbacteria bacterium]|nr:5-formyltetrahydrofolate cyclo-ligase [Candidatus Margulisiibacteriota bacterium]
MNKKQLREKILLQRRALTAPEIELRSNKIIKNLMEYIESINYNTIAFYYPIYNEADIRPLYDFCWNNNKNVLLPYAYKNGNMEFKLFEKKSFLKKDDYGIPSPKTESIFPADLIDIIVVPCVACDKNNNRMGYGAGFYDRFLGKTSAITIGICFDFQLLYQIPTTNNDKKLAAIITD